MTGMTWAEHELGEASQWQGMHDLRRAVEGAEILREAGSLD